MFHIFGGYKKDKELEALMEEINSNVSNNYKDAAQTAFQLFEKTLEEKNTHGSLNEKQSAFYEEKKKNYEETLKAFTHKDQKPYWN